MDQPTLEVAAPTAVSCAPFPASTAAMEDPRMSKARVEKLKRRIIRTVAGKLSQKPDEKEIENMWSMMRKTCKCDCKLLWKHMRAVTLKKLKRLISADDRVDDIRAIARLTVTDWLLYDLVLAHEDIDVIGQEIWEKTGEEPEPLMELFFLVDEYDIELLEGNKLIEAWLNLTREYNESGRKCSPMLLQRRWYQMKEATRKAFYVFWSKYRGKTKYLKKYAEYKPTALQLDIAKRYKNLIITSFPDWNELIKNKKIILAQEFENYITSLRTGAKKDAEPDLQVVEQKIDTINVDDDSDVEQQNLYAASAQTSKTIKIETENIDLTEGDDKDINFLREMNIPCETPFANDDSPLVIDCGDVFNAESRDANDRKRDAQNSFDDDDILIETNDINVQVSAIMKSNEDNTVLDTNYGDDSDFDVKALSKDTNDVYGTACGDSSDSDVTEITDIFNSSQIEIETPFFTTSESDFWQTECQVNAAGQDGVGNGKINKNEESMIKVNTFLPKIESVTSINDEFSSTEISVKNLLAQKASELEQSRTKSESIALADNLKAKRVENSAANDLELLGNFDEIPKDLQFLDDGIVLDEEGEIANNNEAKNNKRLSSETKTPKIDVKLLLYSTVYTKKLDHMDVFKFIEFDNVRDKRVIEYAEIESKPVDLKAVKFEDISLPKADISVKKETGTSDQDDDALNMVHAVIKEAENIKYPENHEDQHTTQKDICDEEDDELLLIIKNRVDPNSKMFEKPRIKKYNPVQLCKNPDFNTRLKRLSAGFLSYEKNREYLKRCHPVTIDLHKTFEWHLVGTTMYLDEDKNKASSHDNTSLDTSDDVIEITSNDITATPCERNKVINLPDITEIRRVNQNLLTAEVAPLPIVKNTPSCGESSNQSLFDRKHTEIALSPKSEIEKSDIIQPLVVENTVSFIDVVDKTTEDSSNNKNANKLKPQQKKPYKKRATCNLPWNHPGFFLKEEECLLASDTVDKMLALFSGQEVTTKKKSRVRKRTRKKQSTQTLKNDEQESAKNQEENLSVCPPVDNTKDKSDKGVIPKTNVTEEALAVLSISQIRKKKQFCCWAQKKIIYPNLRRNHPCKKPLCTCCCKYKLLEKFKSSKAISQAQPQPTDEQPSTTQTIKNSRQPSINQSTAKKKIIVNIPAAAEASPSQPIELVPSIVIDGNTNRISVPKCIVRHETHAVNSKSFIDNAPSASNITTVVPNANANILNSAVSNSFETNEKSSLVQNRLRVKRVLTNSKKLHESREPNFSLQHPPPLVSFKRNISISNRNEKPKKPRSKISFGNISKKIQDADTMKKVITNTVKLQVKKDGKSSASPIFLGKNKILLSTVRGPKAQQIPIDPPKIIPKGVNFILLPNNELALSIASGVELESEQIRHLELVIQALQKVLGTSEPSQNDSTMDNHGDTGKNNHINSSTNTEEISDNEINLTVDEEPEKTLNDTDTHNVESLVCGTDLETNKESVDTEKPTTDTNRKTILSDLMEMSGISAEDTKLPEPTPQPAETPSTPCDEEANPPMHPDLLLLLNNPVAIAALTSRPNLSIITAYSDLKFAVENNAKFYKMDVCTGEIGRINVFIKQKQPRNTIPINNNELIDLTSDIEDEDDDDNVVTIIPATKDTRSVLRNKAQHTDAIKPLKLFRAMHPSILKHKDTDTILNSNMSVTCGTMLAGNNTLKVVNLGRRKQNFSQRIKIDLNTASPAEGRDQMEISSINLNECSSDSDDEPLAKKANRNRNTDFANVTGSEPISTHVDDVVYEEMETEFEPSEDTREDCILGV